MMILYDDAIALILKQTLKPAVNKVALLESLGKVAACDMTSPIQVPSFRNSAMDGFAVCAAQLATASKQTPITLSVADAIAAGDDVMTYDAGNVVQIMTGAAVPELYDAVVPIEMVTHENDRVTFISPARKGDHIRHAGEDVAQGHVILRKGECIAPEVVMLLSAVGISEVEVVKLPRLHILSTGNEISDDYAVPLAGSHIYNSNAPYLMARAKTQWLDAVYEGIVRDEPILFEQKVAAIKEPAVIISTGAVSKGAWDFIPDSLKNMGATIHFHRVNIRPGKPVLFATLPNGNFYFGLPGNPISSIIGFSFFVAPLLRALQGLSSVQPLMATLENNFTKKGDFRQFLKSCVWLDNAGVLRVCIADGQESFKISPMVTNNAWVVLEEDKRELLAGERVSVVVYGTLKNETNLKGTKLCQTA